MTGLGTGAFLCQCRWHLTKDKPIRKKNTDERRTNVSPLFTDTQIIGLGLVVARIVSRQGLGVPMELVFRSILSTEAVCGVKSFFDTRLREIVGVSGHDCLGVVV